MPATSYDSLIVIGTPCSGPQSSLLASAASAARARARAASIAHDHGVERAVVPLVTGQVGVEQLGGRDVAAAHHPAEVGGGSEGEIHGSDHRRGV